MTKNTTESSFPPFPNAIIQGVARKFVDLYSPIRETPEAFLWLSFITYFGNAISPFVRLDCASSEPRFFGVAIGKSGRTRKSAGQNAARDLFKAAISDKQTIVEGFGSAEGLLSVLTEQASKHPTILHLDEINILASKTSISGSAGIAPLHKLFEDHDYDHRLSQTKHTVKDAYLSVISASTLEDFTTTWDVKHQDAGFFSRLLIVAADTDRRIHRPVDPDPVKLAELVQEVENLVSSLIADPRVLEMDKEADVLWKAFYDAFGDSPEWNRIDTYGFRLMAVQAVLRKETSVSKANVQEIIEFLQYEVAVRAAVAPVLGENPIAKMEESIRRQLPESETMRKRDLQHATNANRRGIEVFERAIGNMARIGEIQVQQKPGSKTVLITRIKIEDEEEIGSPGVLPDVVNKREDTSVSQNPSENAALVEVQSDCLHFSAQPAAQKEMVM